MPALAGRKSPLSPQQTDCYPAFQRLTPPYWPGAGGPLMTGACEGELMRGGSAWVTYD